MLKRRAARVAVICFTLQGILATAGSAVDVGSAFEVEVYPPIEPKEEPGESPVKDPPFVTPQGPDRWFSEKALAAFDPNVPKPDDIVPIAESGKRKIATDGLRSLTAEATVITSFAGLNQLSLPENNDALPPDTTLAKSGFRYYRGGQQIAPTLAQLWCAGPDQEPPVLLWRTPPRGSDV